jgi:hypothetical protein
MLASRALQYIRVSGGLAARRQRIQRISGIVADAKAFGLRQQVERTPIAVTPSSNERRRSSDGKRRWPEPLQLAAAKLVEEALAFGSLEVLHPTTALLRANGQFEEGNGARSFGLLGDGCMMRALEALAASVRSSDEADAAHRVAWRILRALRRVEGYATISATSAVRGVLSYVLVCADQLRARGFMSEPQFVVAKELRRVLQVQALCSYAAQSARMHAEGVLVDLARFWKRMDEESCKPEMTAVIGDSLSAHPCGALNVILLSNPSFCPESFNPMYMATACKISLNEITTTAIPRLLSCNVQQFLTATFMAHLALWGKPVGDVDGRRFLLDLHDRLGQHCFPDLFGIASRHSNTTNGSDFMMIVCADDCPIHAQLVTARVGNLKCLDLLDREQGIRRKIHELYCSGRPVIGRRAVAEGLFEPETEWIQGPLY